MKDSNSKEIAVESKSISSSTFKPKVLATKLFKQDVSPVDCGIKYNVTKNQELCPLSNRDIISMHFTSTGGVMFIEEYGVKVNVPNGAIEDYCVIEIQATASLFGPYNIPNDCHPISAYVWIGASYTFKQLIEVEIEHHADISNSKDISQLCVLKVCCTNDCTKRNSHHHMMHEITQGYVIRDSVCTLYTNHFCSYCLAARRTELPDRIIVYHYLPEDYKSVDEFKAEVCFCYDLNCCKKVTSKL